MHWREQMKSKSCFLKKVIYFKYGRTVSAKAIELQDQMNTQRALEAEEERKEILKKRN